MDQDKYQSLSKGVFVIPFQSEEGVAGPSSPRARPLRRLYDSAFQHYERAYSEYNTERTSEQLDDISDWLDRCSAEPMLKMKNPIYRLEVGLLQNTSSSLPSLLHTIGSTTCTLHGRDVGDVNSALKAIAIGFIGETTAPAKKTGRTGIEDIESWYKARKNKSALLLHVQEAQLIPSSVLGELMYIFSLHPSVPIRLLLSVPSITHFLSTWTPLEPSAIAISILSSSGGRKRNSGVEAILRASDTATFRISEELAEEIRSEELKSGGGPLLVLKAIKWSLLHHSVNSPLAGLASTSDPQQLKKVQALVNAVIERPDDSTIPGRNLFEITTHRDLASVFNPAPRTSILHALSNSSDYISHSTIDRSVAKESKERSPSPSPVKETSRKRQNTAKENPLTSKRKRTDEVDDAEGDMQGKGEELKELQMLFELWRSAGKSVNLWDWLEGFSGVMSEPEPQQEAKPIIEGEDDDRDTQLDGGDTEMEKKEKDGGEHRVEENEARLHAIFIRFVEEARMIGLIRARGKGRKADEVVKGIGLV
ncbi:hypothetical protein I302_106014 [Kwoniella bestiolae CBS 10118]|uniref:Origin recognition complex subunit 3 winged helix C-terminal domain-containing protein n=1 Tax=Kwoniella bestiolae CBS 10118 TaxID=1296100 RepID=A0A1B9G2R5_9TREE|nr:hypothetical protein I302_05138 [Kwoniella bestiolae CBS 10118]OCF25322.1 hypothetical protein I302_05138 [Kwoniella bestiolae CBS 10118]